MIEFWNVVIASIAGGVKSVSGSILGLGASVASWVGLPAGLPPKIR